MTINSQELNLFNKEIRGFRFLYASQCKNICRVSLILGLIICASSFVSGDIGSYSFINVMAIGGTVSSVSFFFLNTIRLLPPLCAFPRRFFHEEKPLPPFISHQIAESIVLEKETNCKQRVTLYELDSKKIYCDFTYHNMTITMPLCHLLKSIPWKNLKLTNKKGTSFISHYTAYGYSTYNSFLRYGTTKSCCFSLGDEKNVLYEVISLSYEMSNYPYAQLSYLGTIHKTPPCPNLLYRNTNLSSSFIEKTYKEGSIVHDPAFWSTSRSPQTYFGRAVSYRILGAKSGVDVQNLREEEVLFHPYTYFRVKSLKKIREGEYEIVLNEVSSP